MRSQLLRLAEQMPTGYADRSTLIRNLESSDGKTNIGLTNFAINALDAGSGYIYGAYGQDVTMAFLKQQQSRVFHGFRCKSDQQRGQFHLRNLRRKACF